MRFTRFLFVALAGLFAFQAIAIADQSTAVVPAAASPARLVREVFLPEVPVVPHSLPTPKPEVVSDWKPGPLMVGSLPEHIDLLEVDIGKQRLLVWGDGTVAATIAISSGMDGYNTPTGSFRIGAKAVNGWSRKWEVVMPWMMQFKGNYTFHQLTHKRGSDQLIGGGSLGSRASHGCIRLPFGIAEQLYHRSPVGTPVSIHQ